MTVNFVVVSDLKYVWNVIISICSKALRQVIGRMSSKCRFQNEVQRYGA